MELEADTLADLDDLSPTDARILDTLEEGRNVPANITDEIDRHSKHVAERISSLVDRGLVQQVGRETVSLYEITPRGRQVLDAHREFHAALAD